MGTEKISSKDVLKVIGVSALVISSFVIPGLPVALGAVHKKWRNVNKSYLGRIIKRLEEQDLIRVSESAGNTILEISEKGKSRVLKYDFEDLQIKKKKHKGKFRLVMFDIPMRFTKGREALRYHLKELDFFQFQKSAWIYPYPCEDEIIFIADFHGVGKYVEILTVDSVLKDQKLKSHFSL